MTVVDEGANLPLDSKLLLFLQRHKMDIIRIYNLSYIFQRENSDRQVLRQLIWCQLAPVYSDLGVILV